MTKALEAAAEELARPDQAFFASRDGIHSNEDGALVAFSLGSFLLNAKEADRRNNLARAARIIRAYAANVTEEMASASENVGRCSQCEALQDYPTPEQIRAAIERGLV